VKNFVILFGAMVCFGAIRGVGEQKSAPAAKPSSSPAATTKSSAAKQSAGTAKQASGDSAAGAQSNLFGGDSNGRPKGPTEITATQEAQFDTKTRTGVFIGNVKVIDPQFTLTADRLTVHLNRDEDGGGLNEADAQGNVVIVHVNQPKTTAPGQPAQTASAPTPAARTASTGPTPVQAQQPPTSTGKSDRALYEAKDGSITLTGWPQVTQGANTHIATAPGVKMVLFRDGRMQTYGSTRTLIEDRTTATNNPNANRAQ
jgi:lipopolysaccharide export system protein LptA